MNATVANKDDRAKACSNPSNAVRLEIRELLCLFCLKIVCIEVVDRCAIRQEKNLIVDPFGKVVVVAPLRQLLNFTVSGIRQPDPPLCAAPIITPLADAL